MNSNLGLEETTGSGNVVLTPEQTNAQAGRVKTLGVVAWLLVLTGFIPVLGFFGLIAAILVARRAMRVSREYLLPIEAEKPAYYASIVALVFLILGTIGLIFWIL
ncbi:MAG TPA: hypothetical protein VGC76_17525 [Pyrinomonadaceae bacterium]|jgi:hypothetical protein